MNHDDGETLAVIQCQDCGDLCTECDRVLHMPKNKRPHVRKVCSNQIITCFLHATCIILTFYLHAFF